MCDTLVVVGSRSVLFAKNSDRDPNEAQVLEWHPRREHAEGTSLRCTWIEIPQVRQTHAVLLSRPFWMWGAEMGANEHGLVIGNEAVFTNQPYAKLGLTGMDILRLALERADDAESAVRVMVELLETHGQGGGCGHEHPGFTYHNSFLIADPTRAIVLETAGRAWATEEVRGGRSISNALTIPGFAEKHSDRIRTWASGARLRGSRTQCLAESARMPGDMAAILRDHGAWTQRPALFDGQRRSQRAVRSRGRRNPRGVSNRGELDCRDSHRVRSATGRPGPPLRAAESSSRFAWTSRSTSARRRRIGPRTAHCGGRGNGCTARSSATRRLSCRS